MHPDILLQLARAELHNRLEEADGRRLAASARRDAGPARRSQRLRAFPPLKSSRQLFSESSTSNFLAAARMRFHARSRSASDTPST